MKLLIYVGSPRSKGNSYRLAREFEHILSKLGVEYDVVYCSNTLHPCMHCGFCSKGYCCIKDDWYDYIRNFKSEYDGLVLISPIYFFHFSAQTKAFIDRLGGSNGWKNKILACITASGSRGFLGGNSLIISSMKRTACYHKCYYAGCYNKVTNDKILDLDVKDKLSLSVLAHRILRCYDEINKKESYK